MSDVPALKMTGICKRFGPVQALSDVTFAARRGAVHALCGENGAGKSTLMKILAGVYRPDRGSVEIDGRRAQFEGPAAAIASGVSMIYQELDLAEDLTVAENVFLGAEPRVRVPLFVDRRRMAAETRALTGRMQFDLDPDAKVSALSTGDCQIVEILKALRRDASIVVMDEPTSSLSENESERLFQVIRQLRDRGMTIVYISHRIEEIKALADDITVLRDGETAHSAPAAEMSVDRIVRHMVGREMNEFYPRRRVELGDVCVRVDALSSANGIRNVSFSLRRGEIAGMAGLVGSGRTETARVLFGVDARTSGTFALCGEETDVKSPVDAVARGMAYLTEDRKRTGLCLGLPCVWNVTLPNLKRIGMRRILRPGKEVRIATELAARVNLRWASPLAPADSLSGGNQQKLLIARWLLADSTFLIFDEPTRGIDVGAKREVYTLLNELAAAGKAILLISSELPELFGVADRILVMRRGELAGDLTVNRTTPEEVMRLAAL